MSLDWDRELLGPVMAIFGEGSIDDPSSWPVYVMADGTRLPLVGAVFDEQYQRVVSIDDTTQSATHPVLGVRDALFADYLEEPRQNALVYVPSVATWFKVANPEPDGHGHTLLILIRTRS